MTPPTDDPYVDDVFAGKVARNLSLDELEQPSA